MELPTKKVKAARKSPKKKYCTKKLKVVKYMEYGINKIN